MATTESEAKKTAEAVWDIVADASQYSFNACLSGKEKLWREVTRQGGFFPTIEEMWRICHDKEYAQRTGHIHLHGKYRCVRTGYGCTLSMFDDGRCHPNHIVDIRQAGIRQTYRITLENGASIVCTANHKFPTPNGQKRCDELTISDSLYIKDGYELKYNTVPLTKGDYEPNYPKKGEMGFQPRPNGASVKYNGFKEYCREKKLCCERCGLEYNPAIRFEVHHRDMDRTNNDWSNFQWLCNACHKKTHYELGRTKRGEKGYPVSSCKIVRIEPAEIEMTYDVEMADPAHNFSTSQGIITCNSHSVAVALDALYGAYAKAHFPYEYYSALLDDCAELGHKDKAALIKTEMKRAFGIDVALPRFGQDNRKLLIDKERHRIVDALPSIKHISATVANALYEMKDERFENFVDVLVRMDEHRAFNTRTIEILIRIGYFEQFGEAGTLLDIFRAFTEGDIHYAKTYADATKQKRLAALHAYEQEKLATPRLIPPYEQLAFETSCLGNPVTRFEKEPKLYSVLDIRERRNAWVLTVYGAKSGKTGEVKVKKATYSEHPLKAGEVFKVFDFERKPAMTFVNGERKYLDRNDIWLRQYEPIPVAIKI